MRKRLSQPVVGLLFPLLCFLVVASQGWAETASLQQLVTEAQALIQKGDLAGARKSLSQTIKDFPNEPSVHNLLGVVEAQEANYRAAESHFIKALDLAPRYEGALLNLGRLYQEQPEVAPKARDKAMDVYERLLKVNPQSLEAKYQLALLLHRQGNFRESLDYLGLIPADYLDRAQVLSLLCADHVGLGELDRAKDAAERLAISTDLTELEVIPILPLLTERKASELAALLLEALDRRGLASWQALFQLGLLYEQQGRLMQARAALLKAAELKPNTVAILLELARVAEKQRDYTSALSFLAHARDLEPKNAGIHFFFGVVCLEMKLIVEAHRSLKEAVTLKPTDPYYNYAMGVATVQRSQYKESLKYFQKYCELRPDDARGKLVVGIAYLYSHEPELARKELSFTVKLPETAAASHYLLARLANQEGDLAEAFEHIEQSLKLAPNSPEALAVLGSLHLKERNYERAEQALAKALALDPDSYQASLYLTMLYSRTRDPRAAAQQKAFDDLRKRMNEKVKEFYRIIEVRP